MAKKKRKKTESRITCVSIADLAIKWNVPSKEINKLVDDELLPRKHFRLHNKPAQRVIFRAGLEIIEPMVKSLTEPHSKTENTAENEENVKPAADSVKKAANAASTRQKLPILPQPSSKWDDGMETLPYDTFMSIFAAKPVPEPISSDYKAGDILHVKIVGDPERGKPMNTRLVWVEVLGERCRCVVSPLKRKGMKAKQTIKVRCEDKETGLFKHV